MPEKNYHQMEEKDFVKYLSSLGDSIVCVYSDDSKEVSVSLSIQITRDLPCSAAFSTAS